MLTSGPDTNTYGYIFFIIITDVDVSVLVACQVSLSVLHRLFILQNKKCGPKLRSRRLP